MLTPDICVVGAGSGGLTVAAGAAAFGVSVVLVERGLMGGDCLNAGCVPSKSLIAAARHADAVRAAPAFGVDAGAPAVDFARVHAHIRRVIDGIAPHDSVERFTSLGVRVIQGEARFTDARTMAVGGDTIRARRFVLATGSRPRVPNVPGLESVPFLTNETVFERTAPMPHLLVLGGGPVGVELAQSFCRLGSRVTLVTSGTLLAREDAEMVAPVRERLLAEGVAIHENAAVRRAEGDAGAVRLHLDGGLVLGGTHLLVAAGRTPTLEGLGLDKAGIAWGTDGVAVSKRLRTTNRRVYAVGDCAAGLPRFTHAANYEAGLVLRTLLFRLPVRVEAPLVPRVTYCEPELAHVGLSEADARAAKRSHTVLRSPFAENDRARAGRETAGGVKIVAGKRGRILGVTITGANAGELIGLWSFAIARKQPLSALLGYVAPYPTLGEITKRGALGYFSSAPRNRMVRWIVTLLQGFG